MKKWKFMLLMVGVSLIAPVYAGEKWKEPHLGQLGLSETPMIGAHCDGAEKSITTLETQEQETIKKVTRSAAHNGRS